MIHTLGWGPLALILAASSLNMLSYACSSNLHIATVSGYFYYQDPTNFQLPLLSRLNEHNDYYFVQIV